MSMGTNVDICFYMGVRSYEKTLIGCHPRWIFLPLPSHVILAQMEYHTEGLHLIFWLLRSMRYCEFPSGLSTCGLDPQ